MEDLVLLYSIVSGYLRSIISAGMRFAVRPSDQGQKGKGQGRSQGF